MAEKTTPERPFGITLLMIYGLLVGLANVATGIFVILDRNDPDLLNESFHTSSQLVAGGITSIVLGAVMILIATALGNANRFVRVIYAVVASLNLVGGLWAALALHGEQRVAGIFSALFAILVLYLLFNREAEEYFESN